MALVGVVLEPFHFFFLTHLLHLLLAALVLHVAVADLHHLLCFFLGFFDLFPSFFLFEFQKGDTVGEEFGVIGSFLFVLTGGDESTSDLIFFIIVVVLLLLLHLLVWIRLWLRLRILLARLVQRMSCSLRHWLLLGWRVKAVIFRVLGM